MTVSDPGLADLLAAHSVFSFTERGGRNCNCGWTGLDHPAHVALVVEQHTNGRIAELREWQIKVAQGLGMCEGVTGVGYSIASAKDAAERAESLTTLELEHIECPVWCHDCERVERWNSCTHCNGSGCGPGTASGAYEECEWCAGDGRAHGPSPEGRAETAEATVARVEAQRVQFDLNGMHIAANRVRAALEGEQR